MTDSLILSQAEIDKFHDQGYLIIQDFYNLEDEIIPIQKAIHQIIDLVIERHSIKLQRAAFCGTNFDDGYLDLIAIDRNFGSEIYDLVKQIPSFIRLIASQKAERLFCHLRKTDAPGIGAASYGIRIDNPFEDQFRSQWHQEFFYQPQSLDGLVFWTPLIPLSSEMGPVIVCEQSHKDGLCLYSRPKEYANKTGAYTIGIKDDQDVVKNYRQVAPLTKPGDLIIMDFLTIHQSGFNISNRSRWSIQSRFFNYKEETGMRIGWKASVTAGSHIEKIFPENFTE